MFVLTLDWKYIRRFCQEHPIDWRDAEREQASLGGAGDVKTPTPAVEAFFSLLQARHGDLPTQAEYAHYCQESVWAAWYRAQAPRVQQGITVRLYRNFYPSCVDQLYCWALLGTRCFSNNTPVFDRCLIDTEHDAQGKVDVLLHRGPEAIRIQIHANTGAARTAAAHKAKFRGQVPPGTVWLTFRAHPSLREEGNKCWPHWPGDFKPIFQRAAQLWLFPVYAKALHANIL